jgi:hypothetical protein
MFNVQVPRLFLVLQVELCRQRGIPHAGALKDVLIERLKKAGVPA